MRLLDRLIDRAAKALPTTLQSRAIIFGSAPMVFAGLKEDVTFDLDLFVDDATYQALRSAGFAEDQDERGLPRIMVAEAVEVVSIWPGLEFETVFASSATREGSRGFRVASLEHVLAFKVDSVREKDRREAEIIRRSLGSSAS
jgi:hypothetical protein